MRSLHPTHQKRRAFSIFGKETTSNSARWSLHILSIPSLIYCSEDETATCKLIWSRFFYKFCIVVFLCNVIYIYFEFSIFISYVCYLFSFPCFESFSFTSEQFIVSTWDWFNYSPNSSYLLLFGLSITFFAQLFPFLPAFTYFSISPVCYFSVIFTLAKYAYFNRFLEYRLFENLSYFFQTELFPLIFRCFHFSIGLFLIFFF